jgi:acetyltransferase
VSIRNLDRMIRPGSIAVIGASRRERAVGAVVLRNVIEGGFAGPIWPVNPKADELMGLKAYPDVETLPAAPDLAVICTPAPTVPGLVATLGARGTKAVVVITAGFREAGAEGAALERRMLEAAKPHLLRILGPNGVGLLAPPSRLNASFAHLQPSKGGVAFLSQSGAVLTTVLDWAQARGVGFSLLASLGGMADVDFGDLLEHLAYDVGTTAVLLYVEQVTGAPKFVSAARALSRLKPVIVIKPGRHEEAAKAAFSHTGALAGADDVYDAAFRRAGMLRVGSLAELFDAVETLARAWTYRGDRLAILTNGGGVGVLAVDGLIDAGGRLAELSPETIARLDPELPANWSRRNPVDIIGDAPGARYRTAVEAIDADPNVDALLVMNCPTAIADGVEAARAVLDAKRDKPLMTSWLGEGAAREARGLFEARGVPSYETPGQAVAAFGMAAAYRRNQAQLLEAPPPSELAPRAGREKARRLVAEALARGDAKLDQIAAKELLACYEIPAVPIRRAADAEQAAQIAAEIGFPVALKIQSPDITHKTDVGGVALDLADADAVRAAAVAMLARVAERAPKARLEGFSVQPMAKRPGAHELIVGLSVDPTFGPVVLFGQGGTAVEVVRDKAVALPPLNRPLVDDLIGRTRVSRLLAGYRGRPAADCDALALVLMRIGEMAADLPELVELDINPLWADADGVLALDARARLAKPEPDQAGMAIAPYPRDLEGEIADLLDARYVLRPVRPEDAGLIEGLIAAGDLEDLRFRFLGGLSAAVESLASRLVQIDYRREIAFLALDAGPDGRARAAGLVRMAADPDDERGEFSILVRSDLKGRGLGEMLMRRLIEHARARGVGVLWGDVAANNVRMLGLADGLGFRRRPRADDLSLFQVELGLR